MLDVTLGLQVSSIVLALFYWKRLSVTFKWLAYFLCLGLFVELLTSILNPHIDNNLPILHAYTLLEFVLSALLYQKIGLFNRYSNKSFWIFIATISCLIVLNSIFLEKILTYNSFARSFIQALVISFSVGYIFQLKKHSPESGALNVMNAAMLLVNAGSLFIFMFGNVLLKNEYSNLFWDINTILNLIFQILIIISIWMASRTRKLQF